MDQSRHPSCVAPPGPIYRNLPFQISNAASSILCRSWGCVRWAKLSGIGGAAVLPHGGDLHSFTSSFHIHETIMTADPVSLQTERVTPALKPQEISFPLPRALHTTGHVHLTVLAHCATVFLSTSTPGDSTGSIKPLGSFVYAMPDVSLQSFWFL